MREPEIARGLLETTGACCLLHEMSTALPVMAVPSLKVIIEAMA